MTSPKDILQTLHLIRAGLTSQLLSKEEVIDWADKIVMKDEEPDIFFIEMSLYKSKSEDDLIYYINSYLNLDNKILQGKPLLALLHKKYTNGEMSLEQTIARLFSFLHLAVFTEKEKLFIYQIDSDYDHTWDSFYGPEAAENKLKKFLNFYKDYSLDNFENLESIGKDLEKDLEKDLKF